MTIDLRQSKYELRAAMRAKLARLGSGTLRQHSASVWERLAVLPAFAQAKSVLIYVSTGAEIETHGLIRQLLALGRHVSVPAFDPAAGSYRPSPIDDFDADLAAGKFGILEPKPRAPQCTPEVLVVPGLAFDVRGHRLGRGKGFFDGLLRESPAPKIALAHDCQVLNEIPTETHDVPVDFIVTETKVVHCQRDK
jgi:5-formyltetrahydrofolate cyclo-ligase